jgi:ABC-2 type transport system permease protein
MMLGAATRSELYRTLRNGRPLFWAYFAFPLLALLLAVVSEVQLAGAPGGRPLADIAARALGAAGNPIVHLFYAVGAATLFAGEYRWETWRLLVPRNSRANIVGAKFVVFALFVSISLAAGLVADLLPRGIGQALSASSTAWELSPGQLGRLAIAFAASLVEAMLIGSIAALVAVATRAFTPAILLPFLLSLGISFTLAYSAPSAKLDLLLLLPPHAADAIRSWAAAGPDGAVSASVAWSATAALAAWLTLLVVAATMIFQRQDLAKE